MNIFEDHVGALLEDAATRVTVHPDLTSVVDSTTAYPRLIERPRSHVVPVALLAAASITAVAVGAAVLVPARVTRRPAERRRARRRPGIPQPHRRVPAAHRRALVGGRDGAGAPAGDDERPPSVGPRYATRQRQPARPDHRLDRRPAHPRPGRRGAHRRRRRHAGLPFQDDDGRHTALLASDTDGGDVVVSGTADADVVTAVLRGLTRIVADSSTTFSIGALPTGYDVIIEPTVQPQAVDSFGIATSSDGNSDGALSIQVVTDLSDLRFYWARQGAPVLRSIFLGGTDEQLTGWYAMPADDSVVMVWTLDPGIVLVLTATRSNITASEAIAIARNVVLTDRDTWAQTDTWRRARPRPTPRLTPATDRWAAARLPARTAEGTGPWSAQPVPYASHVREDLRHHQRGRRAARGGHGRRRGRVRVRPVAAPDRRRSRPTTSPGGCRPRS